MKNFLQAICLVGVVVGVTVLMWPGKTLTVPNTKHKVSPKPPKANSAFNKNLYPTDKANSLWVVVNKGRALPASYVPDQLTVPTLAISQPLAIANQQLRADAANALQSLFSGAADDGYYLSLVSAYRSYANQVSVHDSIAKTQGEAQAEAVSALPGHSEHQTGLAVDVGRQDNKCKLDKCFGDTPEGQWLLSNAYRYGFIVRYQKGKEALTGYDYEPWHIRYVGQELAAQIQATGQTMEQFFGLPAHTDYPKDSLILK